MPQDTARTDHGPFLIISGYHDYRSKRKVDLHFIADHLSRLGKTSFVSLRYSYLTRYRTDPRQDLWDRSGVVETVDGVDCYLWRMLVHPMRLPKKLRIAETAFFAAYSRYLPGPIRAMIEGAGTILIESGIAVVHLPYMRRLNPRARIVYLASDSMEAIDQADYIKRAFRRNAPLVDSAKLPSPYLRGDVPAPIPCFYIPHGIDKAEFAEIGPSPFPAGTRNAVSVGSMLFDRSFFDIASREFPDVTFHVIGSGADGLSTANVVFHPEMPFERTLPFIKHADFAIAPYRAEVEPYLTHTSMKLMQYDFLGVPAVCPDVVVGDSGRRFGYRPGDRASIRAAIEPALAAGRFPPGNQLSWAEVTARLLAPTPDMAVA